jgi:putative ABC transport system ATP-binding protein
MAPSPADATRQGLVERGQTILQARGVSKLYVSGEQTTEALRNLDLDVAAGEMVAVMGPSGSGKTTLLNCLSGLDDITSGTIEVDGRPLHSMSDAERTRHRAEAMGFIFQAFNLIPVFTAAENTELPLLLAGKKPKEARELAVATLKRVGLGHRLDHRPPELSGGEQQRVTIARALAGQPRIVWADEPTGNLDSETAGQVLDLLRELHAEGLTVLLVTHDEGIGHSAQRLVRMRDGEIVSDLPAAQDVGTDHGQVDPEELDPVTRPATRPRAKKTPAKRAPAARKAPARKSPAKKSPTRKSAAKKVSARKASSRKRAAG